MAISIRPVQRDEYESFVRTTSTCFDLAWDASTVDAFARRMRDGDAFGAFVDGRIVSTAYSLPLEVTLPGGLPAPIAWVAAVTTLPEHRDEGIASAVLAEQLRDLARRGAPLAALGTEDQSMYRRLGYGPAAWAHELRLATGQRLLPNAEGVADPACTVSVERTLDPSVAMALHDRARRQVVGEIGRDLRTWEKVVASADEWMLFRDGDELVGIVGAATGPDGSGRTTVRFEEVVSISDATRRAMWRTIWERSSADEVVVRAIGADDPLLSMLSRPGAARITRSAHPWLRIVDVPAALGARSYSAAGTLVIDIIDPVLADNHGRWELDVDALGRGQCTPASRGADVEIGIADLAALFLGGRTARSLAGAGSIAVRDGGTVDRIDAMFRSSVSPFSSIWYV